MAVFFLGVRRKKIAIPLATRPTVPHPTPTPIFAPRLMPALYPLPVDGDVGVAVGVGTPVSDNVVVLDGGLVDGSLVTSETSPPVVSHTKARASMSIQLYVLHSEAPGSELQYR
jgi:hypothetical protein